MLVCCLLLLLPLVGHALTRFVSVGTIGAPAQSTSVLITINCPVGQGYTASSSTVVYSGGALAYNMGLIRVVQNHASGVGSWAFQFQNLNPIAVSATVAVVCLK